MKAVLLGATSGMGREIARILAMRGDRIFLLGRTAEDLQRSALDLEFRYTSPTTVGYALCDLERPEHFTPALNAADSALDQFDTVIITAALFATQAELEADPDLLRRLLNINVVNTILFCEQVRERLLNRGGGQLAVFSSVAGDRGRSPVVLYGASKASISAYLEGLDHKFHSQGLSVLCIKPGFVKTEMTANLTPPPFAGDPIHVAKDVVRALDRRQAVLYTPASWSLIMSAIRSLPRSVMRRIHFLSNTLTLGAIENDMLSHYELLLRIASAAIMGGAIGYERNRHGRPIGFRTHLLVAVTAATFMVISSQFAYYQQYTPGGIIEVDSSRIAASVVSATGFLAGGAILRTGATIQGLTSAAGLWLVTSIGLGAGSGMYIESGFVTLLGLLSLTWLRRFEGKDDTIARRRVALVMSEDAPPVTTLITSLTDLGGNVMDVEYERWLDDKRKIAVTFDLTLPISVSINHLIEHLERHPGIKRVRVSHELTSRMACWS